VIGAQFERIRIDILCKGRDLKALRREIVAMRNKMLEAHGNKSELFDLKNDRGGLIDVEFIVQYLVLGYSRTHPQLTANLGNIALLEISGELGLVARDLAERVRIAYREFRRRQHALRLNDAKFARVDPQTVAGHVAAVRALWQQVFGE
jgi:[glutamine synthetase] adenylyltransferase / [glutamine synthetase]-adenylyl-L-tyrosine phosphorylase